MLAYFARRLLWTALVLLGVSILTFVLIRLVPGDVVDIIFQADVGGSFQTETMRAFFGLDQPLHIQLWNWFQDLATGNLGTSFRTGQPVTYEIVTRLPVTIEMILLGTLFSMLFGVPIGVVAAVRRNSWIDTLLRPLSIVGLSIPSFWLGTIFLLLFSLYLPAVSFLGFVPFWEEPLRNLQVMLLPCLALGAVSGAALTRITRASVLEVLNQDYVRTARSKGLVSWVVINKHALRNALIPVVTLLGVEIGTLIGGSVVLEEVFALPGVGRLIITAIQQRDYPVVQGVALMVALGFTLLNLFIDFIYAILDPRIRYQ